MSLDTNGRYLRQYAPDPDLAAFIHALPKTETHLHIEGALPLDLLRGLSPEMFFDAPPPWWDRSYRYADFPTFEKVLLDHALLWFTSVDRYFEAAQVVFSDLRDQNVRYVETSFHLPIVQIIGGDGPAIVDAIRSAAPDGMIVRVFAGMLRCDYTAAMAPVIDGLGDWENLAGVDLHGLETLDVEPWTAKVWERVRSSGKETKAHAGEFGGAANVRHAVEELGVRRVQHGVRAVEDPSVVELLRDRDVTCDMCPISNLKLGVVESIDRHPVRELMEAGVRCTINTDDPFSFGNTLSEEYAALAMEADFTRAELIQVARNGFEVATMDEDLRRACLAGLDGIARGS